MKNTVFKKTIKKTLKKSGLVEKPDRVDIRNTDGRTALEEIKNVFDGYDRDHIWAFVAGQQSQDFRGNPKYLFVYINRYRPDIKAYWICEDEKTIDLIRSLGFHAYSYTEPATQYLIDRTGVVVAEQVKYAVPDGFENVKYINLWHGIGFKTIERHLYKGDLAMNLARKYVQRGTFYRDHQLMNATSPFFEEEFTGDVGVDYDKFLRTGYPRCLYQQNFEPIVSFDHDLRRVKGVPANAKLVAYAPTYRAELGGTFAKAIPDMEKLYRFCEENNILFIFKVHPNMENEVGFLKAWETYGNRPYFLFWDNADDFYEIMHTLDLAIVDYSAITSDMIAMGVRHFIRYTFDYDEYMSTVSLHDEHYLERTTGIMCYNFEQLLEAMKTFEERDESKEIERLRNELWSYSQGADDFERIISVAMDFEIKTREFPTLYSFDIFDTLFTRKVLDPMGIFYLVQERIKENGRFPIIFSHNYPQIRHSAEFSLREYFRKSTEQRQSERIEISFDDIFSRISDVYGINSQQTDLLKQWELEAEFDNVVPLPEQIQRVKELLNNGEQVIMISDMYLPKEFIIKLLEKADPVLAKLPLFLSNEYGVLKTNQDLYFEVYKSFSPYYDFKKWIHYGDNKKADETEARKFQINTRLISKPEFGGYQTQLIDALRSYDAFLVAAIQARLNQTTEKKYDQFVISFVSLCFVPYIDWVLRDAERRGYETLYFVSRDGHHLKRIADTIIEERGLSIKTKYIYASRRTWQVPSYIDEIDEWFWQKDYGYFKGITSKENLLKALYLDEEQFRHFFPYINIDTLDFSNKEEYNSVVEIIRNSNEYKSYLLDKAAELRKYNAAYLSQEISPDEKFAFVEFYGRGYAQECFVRLWQHCMRDKTLKVPFYYCRSVLPTLGDAIRYNFTTNDTKAYFIEAIFANMPYKSIERYQLVGEKLEPVFEYVPYQKELFDAMTDYLPRFAKEYINAELLYPEDTDRMLFDFVCSYYNNNVTDPEYAELVGGLIDSVELYAKKREFAPPLKESDLKMLSDKATTRDKMVITSNMRMSVTRSDEQMQKKYRELYQLMPGEDALGGHLLNEDQIKKNADFQKKLTELQDNAGLFASFYENAVSKCDVSNKIVIISNRKRIDNTGLGVLSEKLESLDDFSIHVISLSKTDDKTLQQFAEAIADARYIIVDSAIDVMCRTQLRAGTEMILLPDNPITLRNAGLASTALLEWERRYLQTKGKNDFSVVQIPSQFSKERFVRNYCTNNLVNTDLAGNCSTDLYFNDAFVKQSRKKLASVFPESKGKKVILYIPTLRSRNYCEKWAKLLDMEILRDLIGDKYVVAVNLYSVEAKKGYLNIIDVDGFSKNISKGISQRELMAAADIIVGDYRNTFFESALLHKPVFSTAFDYEQVMRAPGFKDVSNHFEEFIFGPIVTSSYELVNALDHLESYDYGPMERFAEKYFGWCDGKSADRVADYIKTPDH